MTEPICDRCLTEEEDPRGTYSLNLEGQELHYLPDDIVVKPPVGERVKLCKDCFTGFLELLMEWWERPSRPPLPATVGTGDDGGGIEF